MNPGDRSEPSAGSRRHAAIARRAHALWRDRGCPEGEDLAHWLAAEAEFDALAHVAPGSPRDVEDDTPITLDQPEDTSARSRPAHGGQLPPPHCR